MLSSGMVRLSASNRRSLLLHRSHFFSCGGYVVGNIDNIDSNKMKNGCYR